MRAVHLHKDSDKQAPLGFSYVWCSEYYQPIKTVTEIQELVTCHECRKEGNLEIMPTMQLVDAKPQVVKSLSAGQKESNALVQQLIDSKKTGAILTLGEGEEAKAVRAQIRWAGIRLGKAVETSMTPEGHVYFEVTGPFVPKPKAAKTGK